MVSSSDRAFQTGPIVGGQDAPFPIPWQAFFNKNPWCGGTILDDQTILSAAHCFKVCSDLSGLSVMAGAVDWTDSSAQVQ